MGLLLTSEVNALADLNREANRAKHDAIYVRGKRVGHRPW